MLYNAKAGTVAAGGTEMDYVAFGHGTTPLVMLPGLGDGLKTVAGQAMPLALYYKAFARKFRVYIFSRKRVLKQGYSTKDMAKDQMAALEALGIFHFCLMGVSQGGMVAQHMAIHYPRQVKKLVLAVSISRPNEMFCGVVSRWIRLAEKGEYAALMVDTAEQMYTPQKLKSYRWLYPVLTRWGKPKDFTRFLVQAAACLAHDAYSELGRITCPTMVMGGGQDRVVGREAALEMAKRIGKATLLMYEEFGHAAYEESKEFNQKVIDFLTD